MIKEMDIEMIDMAKMQLEARNNVLEEEIRLLLIPKDPEDQKYSC